MESRLERLPDSHRFTRIGAMIVVVFCLIIVLVPGVDSDIKKTSLGIVAAILAGAFGYLKGQESKS